jgi:hypothetical protein
MNVKLLFGIVLFVIGLIAAVFGITSVGIQPQDTTSVMGDSRDPGFPQGLYSVALPAIAALSLAIGGLLIGLSMGNWKHPRTHLEPGDEVVDPEGYHKMKHV